MWHGAPAVTPFDVNVSNAMSLNIPFLSNWIDGDSVLDSVFGVPAGIVQKQIQATKMLRKGQKLRALEYALPEFAAGPLRARRQYKEGITTMSGKTMYEGGKPMKYTAGEAIRRSLGFQPLEKSRLMAVKQTATQLTDYWNRQRLDLLSEYRMSSPSERKALIKEQQAWNRKLMQSQAAGLIKPINNKVRENALKERIDKKKRKFEGKYYGAE
jgi:hypothetical protein